MDETDEGGEVTAPPPNSRWRPPSNGRSLNYYLWLAWAQIGLAAMVAATNISALVHGRSVVAAVLLLFVAAFIGSMAIWRLQGIHAIRRERREADETETSD